MHMSHDQVEAFLLKTFYKKDIYTIAAQFLLAAIVYFEKWGEWEDVHKECKKEEWLLYMTDNILAILIKLKTNNIDRIEVYRHENNLDG